MAKINTYRDLIAWQKSYALTLRVYKIVKGFPKDELFALGLQMRRCALSIPSNIAEGWGRQSRTEYIRFLRIARGSAFELQTQTMLATDLGFAPNDTEINGLVDEVVRLLTALIRSLEKKSDSQ